MRAALLLCLLAGVAEAAPASATDDPHFYRRLADRIYDAKLAGQRRRLAGRFYIPRMPAVEHIAAGHRITRPLRGFQIFGLQHIVASTESLMSLLIEAGAHPEVHLEGKIYSEHPLVVEEMRHRGRIIGDRPWGKTAHLDPRAGAERLVESMRAAARRDPARRFLVIDDGADLIEAVNDAVARDPALAARIVGVQQTRHGTDRLRAVRLRFPVVDIGDSFVKREYEGPLIGRSIALHTIETMKRGGKTGPVFVMGYGAVGRASALALRSEGIAVRTFDTDPTRVALARTDGVPVTATLEAGLAEHDVVLGTTGRIVVDHRNWDALRPHAMLINGASNGTEFDPPFGRHDPVVENLGAPINFGGVSPVPTRYIQLTRGLLYLAALQATRLKRPGLYALEETGQRALVEAVRADLARTHESLEAPSFGIDEL